MQAHDFAPFTALSLIKQDVEKLTKKGKEMYLKSTILIEDSRSSNEYIFECSRQTVEFLEKEVKRSSYTSTFSIPIISKTSR